jgi:hypothetical protein
MGEGDEIIVKMGKGDDGKMMGLGLGLNFSPQTQTPKRRTRIQTGNL